MHYDSVMFVPLFSDLNCRLNWFSGRRSSLDDDNLRTGVENQELIVTPYYVNSGRV